MAYYRECSCCGINLDPGEMCECRTKKEAAQESSDNKNQLHNNTFRDGIQEAISNYGKRRLADSKGGGIR